jgi:hypothetical protein
MTLVFSPSLFSDTLLFVFCVSLAALWHCLSGDFVKPFLSSSAAMAGAVGTDIVCLLMTGGEHEVK